MQVWVFKALSIPLFLVAAVENADVRLMQAGYPTGPVTQSTADAVSKEKVNTFYENTQNQNFICMRCKHKHQLFQL